MSELGELHHPVEKSKDLESSIRESERKLGLHTSYDRLKEASLFIDKKFMNFAVITGSVDTPERMFGDKEWADYVNGRQLAKEYGKQDLSYKFICDLHAALTKRSDPEIAGKLRKSGIKGASYEDTKAPVEYTPDQIRVIEENPQLSFRREPSDDDKSTEGYIVYPYPSAGWRTQELLSKDLVSICDWFNDAKKSERYDPFIVAATLQHKLASLHPFEDKNGTLSRLLMNWSLENDGEAPSILAKPEDDLVTDPFSWIAQVRDGSERYKTIQEKQGELEKAGIQNESALMGLSEERTFYEYIYKYAEDARGVRRGETFLRHGDVENYLFGLHDDLRSFNHHYKKNSAFHNSKGQTGNIDQGGLISSEAKDYYLKSGGKSTQTDRDKYFTDLEVYRGGMMPGTVNERDILRIFTTQTGIASGYMALQEEGIPAISLQEVHTYALEKSFDSYNSTLAKDYLEKFYPSVQSPYTIQQKSLDAMVTEHVGIEFDKPKNTPFVSTSENYDISKKWATDFGNDYTVGRTNAFLLTVRLPKEGVLRTSDDALSGIQPTFATEKELLVAGGIIPESIQKVEIYHKNNIDDPLFLAYREGETIVIEDGRGESFVKKRYQYSEEKNEYILLDTSVLDKKGPSLEEMQIVEDPDLWV